MNGKKVLLLIGSPRGKVSVSDSIGSCLLSALKERGQETEKIFVYPALNNENKMTELLAAVDSCALLILAFPLYVDQFPAPVVELLKRIVEHRQGQQAKPIQTFTAIVNCGFPETTHCRPAQEITRIFAKTAGFCFLGCLATGMGGAIGNRELAKAGAVVRHQVKALKQAAIWIAEGKEIPAEIITLMGKAMMPRWFYNLVAGWGWKRAARKFKTLYCLHDKPYDPEHFI